MGKFTGGLKIAMIMAAGIIAPWTVIGTSAFGWWQYSGLQGERDTQLVRFARMLSNNDSKVVEIAKSLEADPKKAWQGPELQSLDFSDESENIHASIAIVHVAYDISLNRPRLERSLNFFDWKDGGTDATDAFDDMLDSVGLAYPSDSERDAILAEAEKHAKDYTSLPILIAHYDGLFRRGGYQLTLFNTGSDAYLFTVISEKTAQCWNGAGFSMPDKPDDTVVYIEPAIMQSDDYIEKHRPDLKPLVADGLYQQEIPGSACLPVKQVLKDVLFGIEE